MIVSKSQMRIEATLTKPTMKTGLALTLLVAVVSVMPVFGRAQNGSASANQGQVPTFQVTSKLVFLDVTVLDKKGRPVVSGLAKDDFLITEDRRPQKIFSFEPPDVHVVNASGENPGGNAPVMILVLDQLNSRFEDFAYIRWEVQRYLASQPKMLASPTEMMIVGQESMDLVQGFTRDRGELLDALKHIPPALPYKMMNAMFAPERIEQSFDALEQIALESQGMPGRKNIIWVGHGGPGINTIFLPGKLSSELMEYAHSITNMLVDSRITLFVLYPGLSVRQVPFNLTEMDSAIDPGDNDLFGPAGDINFGVFVNETGGKLFFNRNDIDGEIRQAEQMGSEYYTLTYQPHGGSDDGRFRRIRVTLRNPNLRALTKIGYYAPDSRKTVDPLMQRMQRMQSLVAALSATVPFDALPVSLSDVLRHPDAQTVEVMLQVEAKDLHWNPADGGKSDSSLLVMMAALDGTRGIQRIRATRIRFLVNSQDTARIAQQNPLTIDFSVPIRKRTQSVRVAVETDHGGRVGAVEVNHRMLAAAPAVPTPEPHLAAPRRQ